MSAVRRPAPRTVLGPLAAAGSLLLLCGCAGGGERAQPAASPSASQSASAAAAEAVSVEQPWVKAVDSGMTAAFGEVRNDGEAPVTITGAAAEGVARDVELHETVVDAQTGGSVMRAKPDPMVIAPGQSITLEPGGDHIMLMDLTCAPMAGTVLTVDLLLENGSEVPVEMPVRDYAGAQEEYAPGEEPGADSTASAHGAMDHGGTDETSGMDAMEGMDPGAEALPMCGSPS